MTFRMAWRFFLIILLCCQGCGFHLRGFEPLSPQMQQVAIVSEQVDPDFVNMLRSTLHTNHVTTLTAPDHAHYLIVLEKDNMKQTLANVSASTTPRQYQLLYQLEFHITKRNGTMLLPSQMISVPRQVTINNDRILGSNFERHTIEREIRQSAANELLSRFNAHLQS